MPFRGLDFEHRTLRGPPSFVTARSESDEAIRRHFSPLRAKRSNPAAFFAVASEAKQSQIASPNEKNEARNDPFCSSLRGPKARSNPTDVFSVVASEAKQSCPWTRVFETASETKRRPRSDSFDRSFRAAKRRGISEIASQTERRARKDP